MSWKPEVLVDGVWSRNGLVFATKNEAEDNARALMRRWFWVEDARAVEVSEPVNYLWLGGAPVPVPAALFEAKEPPASRVHTTTRDLGFALRDHLEGKKVCHLQDDRETGWSADVDHVDISDASNPIVYMTNGRSFQVRIIWKGDRLPA